MTGTKRIPYRERGPLKSEDSGQRPRWFRCTCAKPVPACGSYQLYHRCCLCDHLIGTWGRK